MGVIIDVKDHNMIMEKSHIEALKNYVDKDISNINDSLNALNNCWKDEKSASVISDLSTSLDNVKTANNDAKIKTEQYLQDIGNILKIY